MSATSAKLLVCVGDKFACIKIIGRANFSSSIDFKTVINELRQKSYTHFVVELSECVLMDSTFLGVLTGFGLRLAPSEAQPESRALELLNPNARITELLENLGVIHLFSLAQGELAELHCRVAHTEVSPLNPSKEEVTRACLEAHETLMAANPKNIAKFKEVTAFLAEDLKKVEVKQADAVKRDA
jgi:anti-anti-sigma regulatory factor